jgi:hypothetical protein
LGGDGKMTATEAAQRMKQALIMLGAALTAYMRAVRNCDYLRLYNIVENMTNAIDTRYNDYLGKSEDVYETFTISDTDLYDGKVGTEIISFINRKLLPQEKEKILEVKNETSVAYSETYSLFGEHLAYTKRLGIYYDNQKLGQGLDFSIFGDSVAFVARYNPLTKEGLYVFCDYASEAECISDANCYWSTEYSMDFCFEKPQNHCVNYLDKNQCNKDDF